MTNNIISKTHQPCPNCGSSDALQINKDGSTKCYSCGKYTPSTNNIPASNVKNYNNNVNSNILYNGEFDDIKKRNISKDVAKFFKVKIDKFDNTYFPLYDHNNNIVATKIRSGKEKRFKYSGKPQNTQLFGQQLFGNSGKILTITEGYEDAMAVYDMLGRKYAVVSVNSASSAVKDIQRNIDFVEGFEKVVLCFDNDKAGIEAANGVAEILSPSKAKIVHFNKYKDANDYLINNDKVSFIDNYWQQKEYVAADIVLFEDGFDAYEESCKSTYLKLPKMLNKLSKMLGGGLRNGEITVVGAPTSVGKTTFINNILFSILEENDYNVGYLGLETTVAEVVNSLINIKSMSNIVVEQRPIRSDYINDEDYNNAIIQYDKYFKEMIEYKKSIFNTIRNKEKLKILDHNGSLDLNTLIQKIRNMIVRYNIEVFFIDPLQQALKNLENDTVKTFMDEILKLAKQTNCSFILVSHTKKLQDNNPHNINEYDLLGSSAINQVAFNTILLSRDKVNKNENIRNSIKMQLVKNRSNGETGEAGWLYFNRDKYRLEESDIVSLGFDIE